MICRVALFLNYFTNGDRQQLQLLLEDRNRSPYSVAATFTTIEDAPPVHGVDVLKHHNRTCDCFGFIN